MLTTLHPPPPTLSLLESTLNHKYLASLLYLIPVTLKKKESYGGLEKMLNGETLPPCGDKREDES